MAVRHPRLSYQFPFLVVRHKAAVFSSYAAEAGGNRALCRGQTRSAGAAASSSSHGQKRRSSKSPIMARHGRVPDLPCSDSR